MVALRQLVLQVRRQVNPTPAARDDAHLLRRWVDQGDEAAFEVLVWRHARLVLEVCRRVLRDEQDAEDAFQATFLILARKAHTILPREGVGALAAWLHRVALRVALHARQRFRPVPLIDEPISDGDDLDWRDLRPVLDEEINRLPEKYRAAFVLCYLEGLTTDQAAQALDCPRGTVATRLAWARDHLRRRLSARGVCASGGAVLLLLQAPPVGGGGGGAVPVGLVSDLLSLVGPHLAGQAPASATAAASSVIALSEEVSRSLIMTAWTKSVVGWLVVAALLSAGWIFGTQALAQKTPKTTKKPGEEEAKPGQKKVVKPGGVAGGGGLKKPGETFDHSGLVAEIAKGGKSFELEMPPTIKGESATRITVKLDDKTKLQYWWIGADGAKLTVGYRAQVKLVKDSKDRAETVVLLGPESPKGVQPALRGKVLEVAADGKSVKVETQPARKGEEAKVQTIKLPATAEVVFFGVGPGEAKMAADQYVAVWLKKGSTDEAARASFHGEKTKGKGDAGGSHVGTVKAVSADGKKITLQLAPKNKGAAGETIEVKLDDKTAQVFDEVKAGQAKAAAGYRAEVWLQAGSKDLAEKIRFARFSPMAKAPAVQGTLKAVSADGKKLEMTLHSKRKGGGEPETKELTLQLTPETRLVYQAVGPDGAKPTRGYAAQVWLAEGSKDRAALVLLQPATGK